MDIAERLKQSITRIYNDLTKVAQSNNHIKFGINVDSIESEGVDTYYDVLGVYPDYYVCSYNVQKGKVISVTIAKRDDYSNRKTILAIGSYDDNTKNPQMGFELLNSKTCHYICTHNVGIITKCNRPIINITLPDYTYICYNDLSDEEKFFLHVKYNLSSIESIEKLMNDDEFLSITDISTGSTVKPNTCMVVSVYFDYINDIEHFGIFLREKIASRINKG